MKNIKDNLFNCRKHWFSTMMFCLLATSPSALLLLPIGKHGEFDYFKWVIFGYLLFLMYMVTQTIIRFENHESTIEELNKEIEELKKKKENGLLS